MYEHESSLAAGMAERAAEIGLGLFNGEGLEVRRKADMTLVTQADLEIETMIRAQLRAAFPDDRVLGEEEGGPHDAEGRIWIVDPIDATSNFARGVPVWATLIALQIDGEIVLGVVNAPALGERYVAVRGEGATLNGRPLAVSEIGSVQDAYVLATRLGGMDPALRTRILQTLDEGWRDRGFGDFWAHLLVARGAADVAVEPELSIWDYAAPSIVVEEAGGRCTTIDGEPLRHGGTILTTNGHLHDEMVARLSGVGGGS